MDEDVDKAMLFGHSPLATLDTVGQEKKGEAATLLEGSGAPVQAEIPVTGQPDELRWATGTLKSHASLDDWTRSN